MSTTSIRLPDELKRRLVQVADHRGQSPHAFMLEVISERVREEERRRDFLDCAEQRYADLLESGATLRWHEMRDYLQRRLTNEATERPQPVTRDPARLAFCTNRSDGAD
jgi:predicted transcriptional regulator